MFIVPRVPQDVKTMTSEQLRAIPTRGEGKHQVTVFMDTSCPHCRDHQRELFPALRDAAEKKQVRLGYQVVNILDGASLAGSRLAACARVEGIGEAEIQEALYELALRWDTLLQASSSASVAPVSAPASTSTAQAAAPGKLRFDQVRDLGVQGFKDSAQQDKLRACIDKPSAAAQAQVKASNDLFMNLKLPGVPMMFLDGQMWDKDYPTLLKLIASGK